MIAPSHLAHATLLSGIWQLSSTVLASGGAAVVVDPGYFPRELAELAATARALGEVQAVVFTHGHWDHVIGWSAFPGAAVWGSPRLAGEVAGGGEAAARGLREAQELDARWYVDRGAPLRWPGELRPLAEGAVLPLGGLDLRALLLPGHSPDGLALLVEGTGLLLCGDYLSPCEIPFVDDLHCYRATLDRLLGLLAAEVDTVIPGHGPRLDRDQARHIAQADRAYLDRLLACAERGDEAEALALELPRAAGTPGMADHHRDNWRQALLATRPGGAGSAA